MTTCVAEASHQPRERLWSHNSTYNRQQEQNVTMQSSLCGLLKLKGLSDHLEAFLWTWTTGLYFLYGRLRDIMYTDPSSSRTLTYWKDRKTANKRNNVITLGFCKYSSFHCLHYLHSPHSFHNSCTRTCNLLSSMATSLRLTVRSVLGQEKSTSDLGFICSLASTDIGRKTGTQIKKMLNLLQKTRDMRPYVAFCLYEITNLWYRMTHRTRTLEMCWWWITLCDIAILHRKYSANYICTGFTCRVLCTQK